MSSGKKTSTTNSMSSETATTYPNTPQFAAAPVNNYYEALNNLAQQNQTSHPGSQYIAPANELQWQGYSNAYDLGGWKSPLTASANMATNAANQSVAPVSGSFANPVTGNTSSANLTLASAANPGTAKSYDPTNATAQGYTAPTLGNAATAGLFSVNAPTLGTAAQAAGATAAAPGFAHAQQAGYRDATAAQAGPAAQAGLINASAASLGPASQAGTTMANAAGVLDNGLSQYQNPYQQQVIDATLANLDAQTARQRNQLQAQAGLDHAFGGSGYAIQKAQFDTDAALNRAVEEANLRNQGWQSAIGLAQFDTGNRQATNLANAAALNNTSLFNTGQANDFAQARAGYQQAANLANAAAANQQAQFNTGQTNDTSRFNTGLLNTVNLANQEAYNQNQQFNAGQANNLAATNAQLAGQTGIANANIAAETNRFNAGQTNDFALQQAQLAQQAGLANQSAYNTNQQFNAGQINDRAQQQAGLLANAAQFNAGAANQASQFNAGAANTAGQFNAGQANEFALQNAQNQNAINLANTSAANQNSQFNSGQLNDMTARNVAALNAANQFNAGVANNTNQFNAQLDENAIARQLQAAGLLSQNANIYANSAQGDVASQLAAGNALYNIDQANAQAPLTWMQAYGSLLNPGVIDAFTGKTITSNGSQYGTTQQTGGGGLLGSLAGIASVASAFAPSERRVKRDVTLLGREPDGLGRYRFAYVWDEDDAPARYGVMVDEVERLRPWALGPVISGIQTVNYGAL